MALISRKKPTYKVRPVLRDFLMASSRYSAIPIHYEELQRYDNAIPLYDSNDKDTLWQTVFYNQSDMSAIHKSLKMIYAMLKAYGNMKLIQHLYIDRVDLCVYGNTQPFRVRVVNQINDNFDYFYVKKADASRIYGLELEDLLSPNRVNFLVYDQTLVEEHIAGVPGDMFIDTYLHDNKLNRIRFAKEFVKFNERCFVRLLGDMHSSNFVVDITPDFDEVSYRLRAIDFDQQSYEGRRAIYLPQFYKQNNPIIEVGQAVLTPESTYQYQKEERFLMASRLINSRKKVKRLLKVMQRDTISTEENVHKLREELSDYYEDPSFMWCTNMGQILEKSLYLLLYDREDNKKAADVAFKEVQS